MAMITMARELYFYSLINVCALGGYWGEIEEEVGKRPHW